MKHTRKRRAFAQRPRPIGITPFLGGVANRRIQQRPGPHKGLFYFTGCAAICQFLPPNGAAYYLRGKPSLSPNTSKTLPQM